MDWLTTIIGILYFGAVEGNPFIADIAMTSLPAFTAIKLSTTIFAVLLFCMAERIPKNPRQEQPSLCAHALILKGAYMAATVFLLITVLNNIIVIVSDIRRREPSEISKNSPFSLNKRLRTQAIKTKTTTVFTCLVQIITATSRWSSSLNH